MMLLSHNVMLYVYYNMNLVMCVDFDNVVIYLIMSCCVCYYGMNQVMSVDFDNIVILLTMSCCMCIMI